MPFLPIPPPHPTNFFIVYIKYNVFSKKGALI